MERLLYRIGRSPWRNKFLVKGAMLYTLWFDASHRPTRDMDLLGFGPGEIAHLEALRKRWRHAKGVDQEQWRRRDWSWWQPGGVISWLEVFPDDMNILIALGGDCYWVDDMYCINPGCTRKQSGLWFARVTNGKVEDIGAISVILLSGRFSKFMKEPANERALKRLWGHVRKRPGVLALLDERRRRIKPIGQEIVRLTGGGKGGGICPSPKESGGVTTRARAARERSSKGVVISDLESYAGESNETTFHWHAPG